MYNLTELEDAFPATQLQLGMIYHSLEQPQSAIYHDIFIYEFGIVWNKNTFRKAFEILVDIHPILRSRFNLSDFKEPLQLINKKIGNSLYIKEYRDNLTDITDKKFNKKINDYIDIRKCHRFNFETSPLFELAAFFRKGKLTLVFSFHHSLLDGWSVATFITQLIDTYIKLTKNETIDSKPFTITYRDYVALEKSSRQDNESKIFWQNYLDDYKHSSLLSWKPFYPKTKRITKSHQFIIPDHLSTAAITLAKSLKIPVKSVFLALHCLSLRCFTAQTDILTGIISNGRPEVPESEKILGLFLNTLPYRLQERELTWKQVILHCFEQEKAIHPFRRYPLTSIQRAMDDRQLFDTAFNFVNFHAFKALEKYNEFNFINWQTLEETNFNLFSNYGFHPLTGKLFAKFDYKTDKFIPVQIELLQQYTLLILDRMLAQPNEKVNFSFLARTPLKPFSTNTKSKPRKDKNSKNSFLALLSGVIEKYSYNTAITSKSGSFSYHQLNEKSNALAYYLSLQQISKDTPVAVLMDRDYPLICSILACLKCGNPYLPLDPSLPEERLKHIIDVAKPALILSQNSCQSILGEVDTLIMTWESTPWNTLESQYHQLEKKFFDQSTPNSLAYILFTSGSTGQPKGVAMPHHSLNHLIAWQLSEFKKINQTSLKTLQFAPVGFDVSFQEIFSTLCDGGEVVMISDDERKDLKNLPILIKNHSIQRLFLPYIALLQLAEISVAKNITPVSLQHIITAGEQLKITQEISSFFTKLPKAVLDNHYGPTESHVVTHYRLQGSPSLWPALPPIGKAIDNSFVFVVNEETKLAPIGTPGEIYISGECLARGYYMREDLTKERFIEMSIADQPPTRCYKTGDIGLLLPTGELIYLGRRDNQIKIRGYRVELGEIEVQIQKYNEYKDCIENAAVIVKKSDDSLPFLAAFVQLKEDKTLDSNKLKDYLNSQLPEYMVPQLVQTISTMPLTTSGKIDRLSLDSIQLQLFNDSENIHPRDAVERNLFEIWKKVLPIEATSIKDNFYDLGGNSLDAVRLTSTIEKEMNVQINLSAFVSSPTVEKIAQLISSQKKNYQPSPFITFNQHKGKIPIIMIHPIGGSIICYSSLAKHLGDTIDFHAIESPLFNEDNKITNMESLAKHYISVMDEHLKNNQKIILGGWSFGGFVAFEMAHQLKKEGRDIKSLILLDSITINTSETPKVEETLLLNWFMWELLAGDWSKGHAIEHIDFSNMNDNQRLELVKNKAIEKEILPPYASSSLIKKMYLAFKTNWMALINYKIPTMPDDVILVRAINSLPDVLIDPHNIVCSNHSDYYNGWKQYISGNLKIIDIDGDHLTMMTEPNIEVIANLLKSIVKDEDLGTLPLPPVTDIKKLGFIK